MSSSAPHTFAECFPVTMSAFFPSDAIFAAFPVTQPSPMMISVGRKNFVFISLL